MNLSTEALVIKSINYSDADKIYTLYTPDQGRISAIAKGVRKISSKRAGSLDTLSHIKISLHSGRGDMQGISEVKLIKTFSGVKKHLDLVTAAYYMLELLNKNTQEDFESQELFTLLINSLNLLEKSKLYGVKKEFIVNTFETRFVKMLGYELSLDKCSVCGRILEEETGDWVFNSDLGGLICQTCALSGIHLDKGVIGALKAIDEYKYRRQIDDRHYVQADGFIKSFVGKTLGGVFMSSKVFGV